jgi:hypothetical protein
VTRRWPAMVLVALIGASVAACSDDGPGEGEARLEVDGEAQVDRANGDRETIDDSTDLGRGDRVAMMQGVAVMRLRGGTTFELREGLDEAAGTTVLMGSPPVLEAGDLLVTTPESTHLEADGTDVVVRDGAARVTRAFGMSASAYDAELELDSAGVASEVPALRQVAVPDLGRPRPPRPVDYQDEDPWDVRYLGAAMAFGNDLQRLAHQFTGLLPRNEGRTPGFFKLILPGLEDEADFTQQLLDDVDPDRDTDQGETLIGAAISDLGERGSFVDRWDDVFEFRGEGAAWGIVALDQAVKRDPLFGSVEQAFNASVDEIAQAPAQDEPSPGEEPSGTGNGANDPDGGGDVGTGGGTDSGGGSGGTTPPTTPTTLPPPLPPPPESEPPAELDPIVEPVADLVDDLLGGLLR